MCHRFDEYQTNVWYSRSDFDEEPRTLVKRGMELSGEIDWSPRAWVWVLLE